MAPVIGARFRALGGSGLTIVPVLVVLAHVLFLRGYGWFRDEFYYFACARHLAFGYVDHPALSILPLWIVRAIVGDSIVAARLLAALASGATVAFVGLIARDMGGGRFAQRLAMTCAAIAPVYLAIGSFYSMNVFDILIWAIACWLVVSLMRTPRPATWIGLGVMLGLGVENKISVLWLIGGLSIGLLVFNRTSRPEYLSPAYTVLFAGGAIWLESAIARFASRLQPAVIGALVVGGIATAPLAMPILSVQTYIAYAAALGEEPSTAERKELADLPQFYADRFGWNELIASVTRAYESLAPEERRVAAVYTSNYGEAGAVDVLGRAAGLPYAISGHNNYWLWGPSGYTGEVLIVLNPSRGRLDERFVDVRQVGTIECDHCMPYQNHRPVFVCRRPRQRLAEIWPQVKHFD